MIERLFSLLKTNYPQFGLGDDILRSHATMLVSTGLVTEENVATIALQQKDYLSGLQKFNDKRVTEVIGSIKKSGEEEKAKALEALTEELKKQYEGEKNALLEQIETIKKKNEEEKGQTGDIKAYVEKMLGQQAEQTKKERGEWDERLKEILEASNIQKAELDALKQENEAMKLAKAKEERNKFIGDVAKKLEIPEWRISEGFNITEDMDNSGIEAYLGTVANNIKVASLQPKTAGVLTGGDKGATKEEVLEVLKGF